MESFRFIHISDLHFSTWPGFYNRVVGGAFYQKFLGVTQVLAHLLFRRSGSPKDSYPSSYEDYFASEVSHFLLEEMTSASEDNPLDAVLVTGDLATTGRPNDIKVALDFFQGQGQGALTFTSPLTNLLGIGVPFIFLPGNHDRYQVSRPRLRPWLPGAVEFERVFGNDWDAGQAIMRDSGSFVKSFRLRKGNERLAILCADFTLEDKTHAQEDGDSAYTAAFGYLGRGKVYEDRIQGLVDETKRLLKEFESIAIAWAVHFPPEYPDPDSDLKLLDEHLLLYEAVALKVKVIFAGHTHQEAHYQYAPRRNVNVFCAGTSTSTDTLDKNSVHEITLPVDGGKIDVPGIHHKSIAFEIL